MIIMQKSAQKEAPKTEQNKTKKQQIFIVLSRKQLKSAVQTKKSDYKTNKQGSN